MVASYKNRASQIEVSKDIVRDITSAMLLRGEKSLDMLQALIVYNAWSVHVTVIRLQNITFMQTLY